MKDVRAPAAPNPASLFVGELLFETCACMSIQGLFVASAATAGTAGMSLHFSRVFLFFMWFEPFPSSCSTRLAEYSKSREHARRTFWRRIPGLCCGAFLISPQAAKVVEMSHR
jgi:hypothetical protein